jgi:NADH:ubiquinone oxidoreductase subunit K
MPLGWRSWWPARDGASRMAAAEVSVALALVLELYHRYKTLDTDAVSRMKG